MLQPGKDNLHIKGLVCDNLHINESRQFAFSSLPLQVA